MLINNDKLILINLSLPYYSYNNSIFTLYFVAINLHHVLSHSFYNLELAGSAL